VRVRRLARRSLPYLGSAVSGFVIAYAIVAVFIFPGELVSSDVRVPNVTGLAYAEAAAKLKAAGLKAARGERRYQIGMPEDAVIAQTPLPGSLEPKGASIVLDLSLGQRMGEVPRIVGLTREQAERAIEDAGLDVGDVIQRENEAPRGQVLASSPPGGARVPIPSRVSFTVSAGPATLVVPDLTGQDYVSARSLLVQLGFTVGRVIIDSATTLPPNMVIAQSPAANSSAPAGTAITLTVSGRP
jgi:beta-lactam-binding protein with PASTA domain